MAQPDQETLTLKQPVHTHLPVIDSQNALSLWGAVFLGLNDLDGPGVVMCTQKAVCHIFPFQSYELHLNRIKIFFFICKISLSLTSPHVLSATLDLSEL